MPEEWLLQLDAGRRLLVLQATHGVGQPDSHPRAARGPHGRARRGTLLRLHLNTSGVNTAGERNTSAFTGPGTGTGGGGTGNGTGN